MVTEFEIEITASAADDLANLRAFDRRRIVAAILAKLAREPTMVGHGRKVIDVHPEWEHVEPVWQLRVGHFRAFYDVDTKAAVVYIRRVLRKGAKTTGEIV